MMHQGAKILLVEDDEAIANGLALNLKLEGFATIVVGDGEAALDAIATQRPTLILLDLSLPKKNGLEVLGALRELGDRTPLIVLSARQNEADKVSALRLGADDYVTKPFGVAELLARIDAVLRRLVPMAAPAERGLGFADVSIDLERRVVTRGAAAIALTHLEFELLRFLVQNPERVFSREQLLERVWGIQHKSSPRTVDNFVGQLRAKLEAQPNKPDHFITVRGNGYRFSP
ncbi:MAG: response regulator transcription factor [Planctomycetes bacterium]|nr:response regulator transcription factor [Planctomycetota bacterium]